MMSISERSGKDSTEKQDGGSLDSVGSVSPFAWIQPYQTSDDYALAVLNQRSGYYELGDGDCYTPHELARVWNPKWMRWGDVERAIAATSPNVKGEQP